jgi:para-nitrobenzyl esterase
MPTVVETSLGKLKGSRSGSVDVFRGVPFAAPPVGDLRFSGPVEAAAWAGEREAVAFGPVSFQPMDPLAVMFPRTECNFYHPGAEQSEDCLYLNVWAPADRPSRLRPVLIWIHGGAYICGSGSGLWTDGTRLAAEQELVVVTLNYRLGALGGLAVDDDARSANNMLRDQLAALRWAQENIAAFGGDPKRVTIAGESAGASCVINLMACPQAHGTFQRAIAQSGHAKVTPTGAYAQDVRRQFLAELGLPDDTAVAVLRSIDAPRLLRAQASLTSIMPVSFRPVVDGIFCPAPVLDVFLRGDQARVPLIIGTMADETRLFEALSPGSRDAEGHFDERVAGQFPAAGSSELKELLQFYRDGTQDEGAAWHAFVTDRDWRRPVRELASAHASSGASVYVYEFALKSTALGGKLGACHAMDIPFGFGNLHQPGVGEFIGTDESGRAGRELTQQACFEAWSSFVRGDEPASRCLPAWPLYTPAERPIMTISGAPRAQPDPYRDRLDFWDKLPYAAEPVKNQAHDDE